MFVALGMQDAKRKGCVIFPSLTYLVLSYLSTLSHKRRDFRKKKVNKHINVFFDVLHNFFFSDAYLILSRIERDMIEDVSCSSCKVPVMFDRI